MDSTSTRSTPAGQVPRRHPLPEAPSPVPPLVNGDHLSRAEFERRYAAMPRLQGAELIEGRVYMPSPVKHRGHAEPHALILSWLGTYGARIPSVYCSAGGTVRLDLDNEPQPDAILFIDPARGGQTRIDPDDYVSGAPEFVAEVSASTASYDLHEKLGAYKRNGVLEYLVWRVEDREIDWFVLEGTEYRRLAAEADGTLQSRAFPGLWLDPAALVALDAAAVLDTLRRGLATDAHGAFARRLAPA